MHAVMTHELPEVEASSEIDTVLCNGDLSDPESEEYFGIRTF